MARVTTEDIKIPNRFELCMMSVVRAKMLMTGAEPIVLDSFKTDKPIVAALKEMASDKIDFTVLKKELEKRINNSVLISEIIDDHNKTNKTERLETSDNIDLKSIFDGNINDITTKQDLNQDIEDNNEGGINLHDKSEQKE